MRTSRGLLSPVRRAVHVEQTPRRMYPRRRRLCATSSRNRARRCPLSARWRGSIGRLAVAAFRPHDAAAARNGERSDGVRPTEHRRGCRRWPQLRDRSLAIGFFARPLTEPEARLAQLKECDETLERRAKFPACGASLRIEHDGGRGGGRSLNLLRNSGG
jgi:hypothetical protein